MFLRINKVFSLSKCCKVYEIFNEVYIKTNLMSVYNKA